MTYYRHAIHPQRVISNPHDTRPSRTRPLVPPGRVSAHRSNRTLRALDRHLSRRHQRTARLHTRMRAYAPATPGITAELGAKAAHWPTSDLTRADVMRVQFTRATCVATRSPLCATHSTGDRGSTGPRTTSPTVLPRWYPSGAPEGDANSAPVSTTGWSRHRSRHAMTTRGETASRSAAPPPCQRHTITRVSRSTIRQSPSSSPCALHSARIAPVTTGGRHRLILSRASIWPDLEVGVARGKRGGARWASSCHPWAAPRAARAPERT